MPTVLLVEDDSALRSIFVESLIREGHKVLVYPSGIEAIEGLKNGADEIDAVVADFSMPRLSGIDLVRTLRPTRPTLVAIILSEHWIHPLPEALELTILSKPCSPSRLLAALRERLGTEN